MIPGNYANGFAPRDGEPRFPSLWRGCVGAWASCLGPTGATLRDWSGRANHGTLTNMDPGTDWVLNAGHWALDFDGTDDLVNVPHNSIFNFGSGLFSVSVWLKTNTSARRTVIQKFDFSSASAIETGWYIDILATGVVRATIQTSPPNYYVQDSAVVVNDNLWHHVAFVRVSAGVINVYVDGKPSNGSLLSNGTVTTVNNSQPLQIAGESDLGDASGFSQDFLGLIDDARIVDRAWNHSDILLLSSRRGIAYEMRERALAKPPSGGRLLQLRRACA